MSKLFDDASLAMIPSAYKDGKLYSIRPTDGSGDFTFSRGSNLAATRVNEQGLIEKGRENLFAYSNDFSQWVTINTTETGGQTGYDGSSDAWLLTKTNANGRIYQSISSSGVRSISIYAKAGTLDWVRLQVIDAINNPNVFFDLQNGVIGVNAGANYVDSSIESIGTDGWYRLRITFDKAITLFNIYPAEGDEDTSGTSGSIYIQDAQLEQGLVATDYIETGASTAQAGILEDMPRLDYSGGASCPALLLEPQRSNFMIQSEYFDTAYNITNVGFDYNNSISPEGLQNAAKAIPTNGATLARVWKGPYGSGSQVASVFAKAGEYDSIYLAVFSGSIYKYAAYNLSNGSLISATADNYGIEDYGNGWYRVWVFASSTARYVNLSIGNSTDTIGNVGFEISANGTDGLYIYGYQVERDASYPTSYIPTYGSSVTRSEDACNSGSLSSTFDDSQGVLFAEFNPSFPEASSRQITINDTSYSNRIIIEVRESGTKIRGFVTSGGSSEFESTKNISVVDTTYKVAIKYSATDTSFFVNGEKISSATGTIAMPTGLEYLSFTGRYNDNGLAFESRTKQLAYFPTALTDSECIALTTL